MSRAVKQPVGQKRLTNIAVVRLKKGGKRFEVACYRNKVADWRAGIEKDLDEVLQTTAIFSNVGKGVMASKEELQEAFGTTDEERICLEILARGELQVSDKERQAQQDNLFKDVASILVDKTVNPQTSRPYTLTMLERALRDVHFNPDAKKSAKQQALELLPVLQQRFPIQRARMRLKLQVPLQHQQTLLDMLDASSAAVESVDAVGPSCVVVTQVEPGVFRELHVFLQESVARQGRVEVLSFAVTADAAAGSEDFASLTPAPPATPAAPAAAAPGAGQHGPHALTEDAVRAAAGGAASTSGRASDGAAAAGAAAAGVAAQPQPGQARGGGAAPAVLYARGPIAGLPDEYASRRERFAELDQLQAGWSVELRARGDSVDAVFFAPNGAAAGTFATARRAALAASKAGA